MGGREKTDSGNEVVLFNFDRRLSYNLTSKIYSEFCLEADHMLARVDFLEEREPEHLKA